MQEFSAKLLEETTLLERASWHLQNAMHGVDLLVPREGQASALAAMLQRQWLAPVLPWVAAALLVLSVIEPPFWCTRIESATDGAVRLCGDAAYPSWAVPSPPQAAARAVEALALLLFTADVGLSTVIYGTSRAAFAADAPRTINALVVLAAICDAAYVALTPRGSQPWSATPFLRAALQVTHSSPLRQQLAVVWAASLCCYGAASLLAVFVCYCGWLSTIIFPKGTPEAEEVLPDAIEAAWQLLTLTTTANFPDVMMPAYRANRTCVVFFVTFVLLGVFFLSNYLLATVWGAHKAQDQLLLSRRIAARRRSLVAAFDCLDWEGTGALSRERMEALLDRLPASFSGVDRWGLGPAALASFRLGSNTARASSPITAATSSNLSPSVRMSRRLLFAVLDASGDGAIERDEFMFVCDVLLLRFRQVFPTPPLAQRLARLLGCTSVVGACKRVSLWLSDARFEYSVDALLVASACSLAFESSTRRLSVCQLVLSLLFALELLLRLAFLPLASYLRPIGAKIDVLASLLAVGLAGYLFLPNGFDDGSAVHALLALRLLRLVRLLAKVPAYREIFDTFTKLLPAAATLSGAFALVLFAFASLGMQLFGGVITTDLASGLVLTPQQARALAASEFGRADYYPNSFNDLPSGLVTLFELLVVNNWQVVTSGYVAVCGRYARWFFISFWAVGVVVMLNVLVAFVLESYDAFAGSGAPEQVLASGAVLRDDHVLVSPEHLALYEDALGCDAQSTFEVKLHHLPLQKRTAWREILITLFEQQRRSTVLAQAELSPSGSAAVKRMSFHSLVEMVLEETSRRTVARDVPSSLRSSASASRGSARSSLPLHLLSRDSTTEERGWSRGAGASSSSADGF